MNKVRKVYLQSTMENNKLKEIDFKFVEIENLVTLILQAPNNQRLITKLYMLMKPIFKTYLKDEEVFNDYFMKVLAIIPSIDPNKSLKNFFITISKNMEINEYVKKNRKKHTTVLYDTDTTNYLASSIQEEIEQKKERELLEAENDRKLSLITSTLSQEDADFFNGYYKLNRKKTAKERLRMHKLKKLIIERWNQN